LLIILFGLPLLGLREWLLSSFLVLLGLIIKGTLLRIRFIFLM
jgi:hypothetical protein